MINQNIDKKLLDKITSISPFIAACLSGKLDIFDVLKIKQEAQEYGLGAADFYDWEHGINPWEKKNAFN